MILLILGKALARVEWPASTLFSRMTRDTTTLHTPCNVEWSNPFRFDPNDQSNDKCVHFTAFAKGTVYIIFSSIPTKKETWYFIEISQYGVVIYKVTYVCFNFSKLIHGSSVVHELKQDRNQWVILFECKQTKWLMVLAAIFW